ncbi:serine/arginine repetitive matrix protein 2-like isoform X2 [Anopheles albimanus]|uniref:serine/arginine repetitive matrix protein 2-like isoform X2 n=1 Tax=Anopheles albimanus TaxID=7167 RepID=UPI001641F6D5|nr:serine/arginine repetitive matrix protein 2-like isoform X2 [Anopheles albimanus]
MYNGIGLTTPRGSGTNGHVQRNVAFVRPGKKDNINYRTEDDLAKLDSQSNRQPNQGILDHERKRKIEVKCAELEEVLESQGLSQDEVRAKVELYRSKLMNQGTIELPKDEFGRLLVRETHHIAQAQQEKNAKLRDAFGISQYFVEGTSFDQDRKAKEDLAKSEALQKELAEKEKAKELERANRKRYALVRTPSPEKERDKSADRNGAGKRERDNGQDDDDDDDDEGGHDTDGKIASKASRGKDEKKKKKKKARDTSSSPERKKEKKKKSKKSKKER